MDAWTAQKKRIVILTPDVAIDRRILHQAEALIEMGHEVYLLAGSATAETSFELVGNVRVERIAHDGVSPRRRLLHKASGLFTTYFAHCVEKAVYYAALYKDRGCMFINTQVIPKAPYLRIFGLAAKAILIGSHRCVSAVLGKTAPLIVRGVHFLTRVTDKVLTGLPGISAYEHAYFEEAAFYRPDLIHVHDLPMLPIGAALKRKFKVPLIYDMHEFYPEQPRLTEKERTWLRNRERKHVGAADVVITVNELLGEVIQKRYGLPRIDIIQNAIHAPHFDAAKKYDRLREDYPQLHGKILVLYQGWIAEGRNLENAVKAMTYVTNPDIVLLIMGYGDYAQTLQQMANELQVADRVVFVPAKGQDELLSYTASADVGLIPYPTGQDINTHFVSPNKLYEFVTARLPILTNELPFMMKVIAENGIGWVANLNDPSAFGKALNEIDLAKLGPYRQALIRNGWKLSWDHEKSKLIEIYRRLLGPSVLANQTLTHHADSAMEGAARNRAA